MSTPKRDEGAEEAARYGIHRSDEWPKVERAHLAHEPRCVACAGGSALAAVQVHHVFPFHYCIALGRPDLELDDRNLITLCEDEESAPGANHHLLVGHLASFRSGNLDVVQDAKTTFFGMSPEKIRADPRWKAKVATRLAPLGEMSADEKAAFTKEMNDRLPRLVHQNG